MKTNRRKFISADALTIPVSNGEQDQSLVNFRWSIAHDGIDIVQPDNQKSNCRISRYGG
jgi:hypothetical protein